MKQKLKLIIIFGVEFVCILVMLILIFFAGKKSYTVEFNLNGGTLISGDLVQKVIKGNNATPPSATKDGATLKGWTGSYRMVTHDVESFAIWEYETTTGLEYKIIENSNYCTVVGCYKNISGPVYIGDSYQNLKVLEIEEDAFANCPYITEVYLLDGILKIKDGAFKNCPQLEKIEIPRTVIEIGNNVFEGCEKLEKVNLPQDLKVLGNEVFKGCTSLKEIQMPEKLASLGDNVFDSDEIEITFVQTQKEVEELYQNIWYTGEPTIKYAEEEVEEEEKSPHKNRQ